MSLKRLMSLELSSGEVRLISHEASETTPRHNGRYRQFV